MRPKTIYASNGSLCVPWNLYSSQTEPPRGIPLCKIFRFESPQGFQKIYRVAGSLITNLIYFPKISKLKTHRAQILQKNFSKNTAGHGQLYWLLYIQNYRRCGLFLKKHATPQRRFWQGHKATWKKPWAVIRSSKSEKFHLNYFWFKWKF